MQKEFDTIIFDFDGTLADSFAVLLHIIQQHAEKFGYKSVDEADIARLKNSHWKEIIDEFEIGLAKIPFIMRFVLKEVEKQREYIPIFDGVADMLGTLHARGYKLRILSSNKSTVVNAVLEKYGLENYFLSVHHSRNLFGKAKSLTTICRKFKLPKERVLYIGDEVRDIEGAQGAHIKVCAVLWGYNTRGILEQSKPDYMVASVDELLELLQ